MISRGPSPSGSTTPLIRSSRPVLHLRQRAREPPRLPVRVVGQQAGRGLAQTEADHRADGDAGHQRHALEAPRHGGGQALGGTIGGPARRQHLGQQHRHRLQHLGLVRLVAARRAVLHRQHPQRPPGAAHRHRQHRGEPLLAGLRPVGEGRVVLRVRQVQRLPCGGHQADDALAHAQPGVTYRLGTQALGCHQFQDVAGPQRIDRADLGHQLARHQVDQLRQRFGGARHQLAQARQQATRRADHQVTRALRPRPATPPAGLRMARRGRRARPRPGPPVRR